MISNRNEGVGNYPPSFSFDDVLNYLSNKEWHLVSNYKERIENIKSKASDIESKKQIKNYTKFFKEPLFFKHDLTTYSTGRIFAQYVLFPNKKIGDLYIKELIIPEDNYVFVSFDYSNSQIRHLAVMRNIQWLIENFNNNVDIYQLFADKCELSRDIAKVIMIILLYGGDLNTLQKEFEYIDEYTLRKAVETHNNWFNLNEMSYGEKTALARDIQNIEASFIKRKMLYIYKKQNSKFKLHAVIHDAIILEIHQNHLNNIEKIKTYLEKYNKIKMDVKVSISHTFQFK